MRLGRVAPGTPMPLDPLCVHVREPPHLLARRVARCHGNRELPVNFIAQPLERIPFLARSGPQALIRRIYRFVPQRSRAS